MANEGAIWRLLLTTRNEIPAAVEKDIAALNRLEQKARTTGGGLNRVLGKALPGGGLGNAVGAGFGGGLGATAATGAAFAAVGALRSMVQEAMEMDTNAKKTAEAMKEATRYTDSTVSALAQFGVMLEAIKRTVMSMGASTFAKNINFARVAGGTAIEAMLAKPENSVLGNLIGRIAPGLVPSISTFARDQAARGLAGLGGNDLGEQAVGRLENQLEEAQKRRDARRKVAAVPNPRAPFSPNLDEFARMGLYLGGRGSGEATQLMRDQKLQLELLNRKMSDLAPQIAANL